MTAGGDFSTPEPTGDDIALADLPAKVRVHALAKLLGRSSREVLDVLSGLGEPARSAQSSLDRDIALKVAEALAGGESEPEPEPEQPPLAPVFAAAPVFLPPAAAPPQPRQAPPDEPAAEPESDTEDTEQDAADPADTDDDSPT
ncbi:MAG TPA: translation initiation factor IF-2 N-terminal domain-containing protein, partial [Pseudonocardiaceae bacterium]|nr:translation initiation factor IF-2 N-terminal domain-containing protein [Pseudonocardiaceae bacterium]